MHKPGSTSAPPDEAIPLVQEAAHSRGSVEEEIIPVVEEEARVGKREVVTGRVRVRTAVEVVREPVTATLEEESVEVTRVPVDRMVEAAPAVREENGVTIVPVLEEVLVVEKRLVLKEEIHIRRQKRSQTVETPVELRKERVTVERLPGDAEAPSPQDRGTAGAGLRSPDG